MRDATAPGGGAEAVPEPGDAELMARVLDGETDRLGELFDRHHRRLFNFFLRWTRDAGAAEDMVQEVFVRMLKYRHTFRSGAEFGPWMYALARNTAHDQWRARPRELPEDPEAPEPAGPFEHPIEGMLAEERRDQLAEALARLAPEKRELLLLARSGELRYEAIGELLGISVGAVKLRVHRAMKDLRGAWHQVAGEAGT
jgi:RNA polymerase sigma-70 factor (ECF subfamily)